MPRWVVTRELRRNADDGCCGGGRGDFLADLGGGGFAVDFLTVEGVLGERAEGSLNDARELAVL